jgi:hypothetical protein
VELANEALYRAQVLNPDYTLAWVGQGLVAEVNQDHKHEYALFEHAVTLPATVVRIYATSVLGISAIIFVLALRRHGFLQATV